MTPTGACIIVLLAPCLVLAACALVWAARRMLEPFLRMTFFAYLAFWGYAIRAARIGRCYGHGDRLVKWASTRAASAADEMSAAIESLLTADDKSPGDADPGPRPEPRE